MNLSSSRKSETAAIVAMLAWIVINILQAVLTPLNNDEAYYWMYSKYLSWGYFDHPPMIALMIKIGYALFRSEAGVRLMSVIAGAGSLVIIWKLVDYDRKLQDGSKLFFILLAASLPLFNIFGFMATPDSPLLFFTALFLLVYRKWTEKQDIGTSVLLSLAMAALVYSKYHGALLIILVIISNLKLLKNPWFWFSGLLALLLFTPHLWWQYENGFPSLKYHLVERVSGLNMKHLPDYVLNLLLIHNPLLFPLALWLIFRKKASGSFGRTLYFILTGFIVFFLLQSFRYHIEPQWTAVLAVPVMIILFNNIHPGTKTAAYFKKVVWVIIPVIFLGRSAFMFDYLPVSFLKKEYHNNRRNAEEIGAIAGLRPVVFTNSYQDPSEYTFYTGKFATSLNNLNYRRTQYDIWKFEEQIHGKEVLYVPHFINSFIRKNFNSVRLSSGDSVFYKVISDFQSLQRTCVIPGSDHYTFSNQGIDTIDLKIFNPYPYTVRIDHPELPVVFQIGFVKNGYRDLKANLVLPAGINTINAGDTLNISCSFSAEGLKEGEYLSGICSETGYLYDVYNSSIFRTTVTGGK